MPELQSALLAPWGRATPLAGATVAPWGRATAVQAFGGAYASLPPAGGDPTTPGDLPPGQSLGPGVYYQQAHTLAVTDLRTGAALAVDSVSLGLDDGAVYWTLAAEGPPRLYGVLTGGEQPALVQVQVDGQTWAFVVETLSRPRSSTPERMSFGGRSVAAVADAPYQFALTYSADAPTTAAQLCAGALLAAGVELDWTLADWLIPAGAVSIQGTPMDVVRAVAAAVGADVTAHPSEYRLAVRSRYPLLPNEWARAAPDVQLHSSVVESETFERADRPAYTGVFVAGQQGGALAYVVLEGTSGADQAPMVTDPLLTEEAALRERARAVLGAGGAQARVARVLPVRTGPGEPGVLQRGQLLRCIDAAENGGAGQSIWHGVVRSVALSARLPLVQQTVALERHTGHLVDPQTAPPLIGHWPIPDLSVSEGEAFTLGLAPYRSGGRAPYTWSLRSGELPAGVSIVGETLSCAAGLPAALTATVSLRVTDAIDQMCDSPPFNIAVINNRFVAVMGGSGGFIRWSDDAFEESSGYATSDPAGVDDCFTGCAGAGKYVGISAGRLWSSADGKHWVLRESRELWAGGSIAWNGRFFLAASRDGAGTWTSADGITWASVGPYPPLGSFWGTVQMVYHPGSDLFVACSSRWDNAQGECRVAVTRDGVVWTRVLTTAPTRRMATIATSGTRVVILSDDSPVAWWSDNPAASWTEIPNIGFSPRVRRLAFGNGVFAAPSSKTDTDVVRSADGITWTRLTTRPASSVPNAAFFDGQKFWAVGTASTRPLFSSDGGTWTLAGDVILGFGGTSHLLFARRMNALNQ